MSPSRAPGCEARDCDFPSFKLTYMEFLEPTGYYETASEDSLVDKTRPLQARWAGLGLDRGNLLY